MHAATEVLTAVPGNRVDRLATEGLVGEDWVDSEIYTRQDVFRTELDKIFATCWICIGHEAEISGPGAYKACSVGRQPILVVRDAGTGELNAYYNRCRHRGVRLLEPGCGRLSRIICPYHGWCYDTAGRLRGVPYSDAYRGVSTFDREALGLVPVARLATYAGLIFVCLAEDVVDLPEYLGHARRYIDSFFPPEGVIASGRHQHQYVGNWKLQMENVVDNYHLGFLHQSWLDIVGDRYQTRLKAPGAAGDLRSWSLSNGHSAIEFHPDGPAAPREKTKGMTPFNVVIFPTLALVADHTIMIVTPLDTDRTAVEVTHVVPAGADDQEVEARTRRQEDFYGPFGFVMPDDFEVAFRRVAEGVKADRADRHVWFNRGLARETVQPDGRRWGHVMDEVPQRAFYRRWLELITA